MKLALSPRSTSKADEKKCSNAQLRRAGQIPAVIYHKTQAAESVSLKESEFTSLVRQIVPGRLSTTVLTLAGANGKERKAIVKDIQYHPVSYKVIHLDLEELHDDQPVKVKVPVVLSGEIDSVGIKLGGMVRVVSRSVAVQCLPKDIPGYFTVDVKNMNIGDVLRVSGLTVPESIKTLTKNESVVLTMVKK